jgi:hypothetical protein
MARLWCGREAVAARKIRGFHRDEQGDWVADLECGHTQHVRHNPPWVMHAWVVTPEGREAHVGKELACKACDAVPGGPDSER